MSYPVVVRVALLLAIAGALGCSTKPVNQPIGGLVGGSSGSNVERKDARGADTVVTADGPLAPAATCLP
jgi:hypothetical protein